MFQDKVEQGRQALILWALGGGVHPAVAAGAVEYREIQLIVIGVQRREEVEHLVDHFLMARIGAVDLVDRDDRAQTQLQGLADDELRLRHRTFCGIDENNGRIDHVEDSLHLAAEIGVAGRIDDIDARALPFHGGALRHDGDAAFLLEVIGIHDALDDARVLTERARLRQKLVNQRGLAMVDVGNNGDIAHFHREVS